MLRPECLHGDTQFHRRIPVCADKLVVLQLDHVALFLRDGGGHPHQLARLVWKQDGYGKDPVSLDEPVLYDGGHGDHVHIASA